MKDFMYVAWFQDNSRHSNEEDYKWVACFVINAKNELAAKSWGDHLATGMCSRNSDEQFLFSEVHFRDDPMYSEENWVTSPHVNFNEEASDNFIGW